MYPFSCIKPLSQMLPCPKPLSIQNHLYSTIIYLDLNYKSSNLMAFWSLIAKNCQDQGTFLFKKKQKKTSGTSVGNLVIFFFTSTFVVVKGINVKSSL